MSTIPNSSSFLVFNQNALNQQALFAAGINPNTPAAPSNQISFAQTVVGHENSFTMLLTAEFAGLINGAILPYQPVMDPLLLGAGNIFAGQQPQPPAPATPPAAEVPAAEVPAAETPAVETPPTQNTAPSTPQPPASSTFVVFDQKALNQQALFSAGVNPNTLAAPSNQINFAQAVIGHENPFTMLLTAEAAGTIQGAVLPYQLYTNPLLLGTGNIFAGYA